MSSSIPNPGEPTHRRRRGRPSPDRDRELLAENLRTRLSRGVRALAALRRPRAAARQVRTGWRTIREFVRAESDPGTSLDRLVGPGRRMAVLRTRLDVITAAGHAFDATVNDVLLTVVGGGVRGLLSGRGDPVQRLVMPMYVPKTLRHGPLDQARGNMIGQMVVPVPVGLADPVERLRRIAAKTRRRKSSPAPSIGTLLGSRAARRLMLKVLDQHPVSATTADLVGPREPLYFCGARVREVFPVLPLIGKVSVAVGAVSYAGGLGMTVVVDADAVPDLDAFVRSAQADLDILFRVVSDAAAQR